MTRPAAERLTPEAWARLVIERINEDPNTDLAPVAVGLMHTAAVIDDAIRAALAERDAAWLAAVRPGDDGKDDDGWLWCGNCDLPLDARTPADMKECCACSWSAALRTLLAAGPTTERME